MIQFSHEKLTVYRTALDFVCWCHEFVNHHRISTATADRLDATSTSIVLNIAEGTGKFPRLERGRFLNMAHSAALRCAAILDVCSVRGHFDESTLEHGKSMLQKIVAMIFGLRMSLENGDED